MNHRSSMIVIKLWQTNYKHNYLSRHSGPWEWDGLKCRCKIGGSKCDAKKKTLFTTENSDYYVE